MASSLLGSLQTRKPSNNPVWSDGWVGNFADLVKHVRLPQSLPQDYYQHTKDGGYDFRFNEHILRGISPKRQRCLHHRKFPPQGQRSRASTLPTCLSSAPKPYSKPNRRLESQGEGSTTWSRGSPISPSRASTIRFRWVILVCLALLFHTWFEFKTAPDDLLSMITSLWSTSCITSICREKPGRSTELISLVNNPNFLHGTKNKDHIKKLMKKGQTFYERAPTLIRDMTKVAPWNVTYLSLTHKSRCFHEMYNTWSLHLPSTKQ